MKLHYMKKKEAARQGEDLAAAVLAFAEWQEQGYGKSADDATRALVTRQLWSEVSDRVHDFTGRRPACPCPSRPE
jgi:hypothetical protein